MAQLLVYTKNGTLRYAVNSLVEDKNDVTFFENRLQFLVCATVLKDAILLIDALPGNSEDIRWLYPKLKLRGVEHNVHYLVPTRIAASNYMKGFSIVTDILKLKSLCRASWKRNVIFNAEGIQNIILKSISEKMSGRDLNFMLEIYNGCGDKCKALTKKENGKLYYLRKKLFLQNAMELKQLILLLSEKNT
ncbi:hypothetical protein M2O40_000684 [Kluyvera ascorbata]|nr:hypothetical protein [Kluyvera ascorbata]